MFQRTFITLSVIACTITTALTLGAEEPESLSTMVERLGHSRLTTGNRVELLVDGPEARERRVELLESARHHLFMSTFLWYLDSSGSDFLERTVRVIRERRAADPDFTALFLFDASAKTKHPFTYRRLVRELRRAGAAVRFFNPQTWAVASIAEARLHDKVLIVDGHSAIVGGRNIGDDYFDPLKEWFDADVLIEGPSVAELQMHFLKEWALDSELHRPERLLAPHEQVRASLRRFWASGRFASGRSPLEPYMDRGFFPAFDVPPGSQQVAVLYDNPLVYETAPSAVLLTALIRHAESEVDIMTAFANFPKEILEAIETAARRGLRVRLLVNSSDTAIRDGLFWKAWISSLKRLLDAGVEVWTWQDNRSQIGADAIADCAPASLPPLLIHGKIVRIDGDLTIVHASNFNYRSVYYNTEAGVLVTEAAFNTQVRLLFDRLLGSESRGHHCTNPEATATSLQAGPLAARITAEDLKAAGGDSEIVLGFVDSMSPLW